MGHSRHPKGLSMKSNGTYKFGLIATAHAQCNLLHLESYLSQLLTLQPLNLEHHAVAHFISFLRVFSFSVIHFMNSKFKNI